MLILFSAILLQRKLGTFFNLWKWFGPANWAAVGIGLLVWSGTMLQGGATAQQLCNHQPRCSFSAAHPLLFFLGNAPLQLSAAEEWMDSSTKDAVLSSGSLLSGQNPSKPSPSEPKVPTPEAPEPPETTHSIQRLFERFLEKPSKESYLQVLDALCRHPAYNPYSTELEEVAQLLDSRRYEEAKAKLDQAMPNLLLSPRAHNYYRVIAEAAGDLQEAQRRDQIAQKCLQGIRATGQGIVDAAAGEPKQGHVPIAPFHVARVSDEYDLIRALGKRSRVHSQSLRRMDGRWYDVLRCSDETGQVFYVWFDVTRLMSALGQQIQHAPPPSQHKENSP
ncbi:MAG: DUF4919 domain-containing protein [Thermoguttaceae bacterium]|nr:DUF4919 domain-containing protein [Thermoguttaceae bacterium]MDW8036758.1 hypothetical protein [Thermoguttaceae bacterium]